MFAASKVLSDTMREWVVTVAQRQCEPSTGFDEDKYKATSELTHCEALMMKQNHNTGTAHGVVGTLARLLQCTFEAILLYVLHRASRLL